MFTKPDVLLDGLLGYGVSYPKVILGGKAGWRTESAVRHKLVIAGYLETAARGGIDRLVVLKDALSGTPYLPALV